MEQQTRYAFTAEHPETGIQVKVYQVDTFVESFVADAMPEFTFLKRFHETEAKQPVYLDSRGDVCKIVTETNTYWMRILK